MFWWAAGVLGPQSLSQLVEPLERESQAVASGANFDWRNAEAALYCIRCALTLHLLAATAARIGRLHSWLRTSEPELLMQVGAPSTTTRRRSATDERAAGLTQPA